MTRQRGSAGRDQYNIGGDYKKYTFKVRPEDLRSALKGDQEGGSDTGRRNTAGGIGFFILFIIIALIANSCHSSSPPAQAAFPTHSDPWPRGATTSSVLAPVLAKLQSCAQAPVLAPVNCPQAEPDPYLNASDIHWTLHGDAASGARIVYRKKAFDIAGSAVMTVTYSDTSGPHLRIEIVHYRASEHWQNDQPALSGIRGVSDSTSPLIKKRKPDIAWNSVQEAVRSAFNQCAATRSMPLPPECPSDPNLAFSISNARWHLTSNPLLNAHGSYDPATGLIHVTGSYAMKVSYDELILGEQHGSEAGNYNAVVSVDGPRISVLAIMAS
jgi:hypothetical protein